MSPPTSGSVRRRWPALTPARAAAACLAILISIRIETSPARPSLPPADTPIRVDRVIDGDTLQLHGGTRVRLLGVNTPETKHPTRPGEPFGEESYDQTRSRVEGQLVRLEYDRERWDPYRRVLAYVYEPTGAMLNRELIRQGYSPAVLTFPIRPDRARELKQIEASAQAEKRNIWSTQ